MGWVTWIGKKDILHHSMLWPVYELGELPRRLANLGLGMCSGISQQVSASLVGFFWFCFLSFFFPFIVIIIIIVINIIVLVMILYYYILVCYPSLNCFYLNLQVLFLIFPPIPLWEEIG